MVGKVVMVQGTASHVGKSMLVTALCRIFNDIGYKVAPFKTQNMSLNSFVTKDGFEIARSQAVQAIAARIEPIVELNPILLKPKGDSTSQLIVMGKPYTDISANDYYSVNIPKLIESIRTSIDLLRRNFDIIVIEGAGSPAEINLMEKDIANMFIAKLVNAPVLLVGDIDRGGVFASIYGTIKLLKLEDQQLVKMFIINKFRGDLNILIPGIDDLEKMLGIKCGGVIPYIKNLKIPSEDSLSLEESKENGILDIKIINFPFISNFTDFESLKWEEEIHLSYVDFPEQLDNADLVIVPGTKNTIKDLNWMVQNGIFKKLKSLAKIGIIIVGICGGYQMLGKRIIDMKIEGDLVGEHEGLGLLPIQTEFLNYDKITKQVSAKFVGFPYFNDIIVNGYEIHMGKTIYESEAQPLLKTTSSDQELGNYFQGAINLSRTVFGCYIHGLWDNDIFREKFIQFLLKKKGVKRKSFIKTNFMELIDKNIQELATTVNENLNIKKIKELIGI